MRRSRVPSRQVPGRRPSARARSPAGRRRGRGGCGRVPAGRCPSPWIAPSEENGIDAAVVGRELSCAIPFVLVRALVHATQSYRDEIFLYHHLTIVSRHWYLVLRHGSPTDWSL